MQIISISATMVCIFFCIRQDENDIDAGALFEYMRYTQEKKKNAI